MLDFILTIVQGAAFASFVSALERLVSDVLRAVTGGVLALAILVGTTGCAVNTEPIERTSNRGIDLLEKALDKAVAELSAQSGQWIGTGALIEPGYRIRVFGGFGPTFWGESEVRVVGASGTLGTATTVGPPNRNVGSFGDSKLPSTEPTPE